MSKAVLMSIQPKWVESIANGKKTIKVQKTRPNRETPFKVYIYCTKSQKHFLQSKDNKFFYCENKDFIGGHGFGLYQRLNGTVIGEFICDRIDEFTPSELGVKCKRFEALHETRLTVTEIREYLKGNTGYGWHISDLKIYDKPKELSEFRKYCGMVERFEVESVEFFENCINCPKLIETDSVLCSVDCGNRITRPPQSWCYVEVEE